MDKLKQTLQSLPVPEPPASLKADVFRRVSEIHGNTKERVKRGYIRGGAALIAASVAIAAALNSSLPLRMDTAIDGIHKNAGIAISRMQSAIYDFNPNKIFNINKKGGN